MGWISDLTRVWHWPGDTDGEYYPDCGVLFDQLVETDEDNVVVTAHPRNSKYSWA